MVDYESTKGSSKSSGGGARGFREAYSGDDDDDDEPAGQRVECNTHQINKNKRKKKKNNCLEFKKKIYIFKLLSEKKKHKKPTYDKPNKQGYKNQMPYFKFTKNINKKH